MKNSPALVLAGCFGVSVLASCSTQAPKVDVGWVGEYVSAPENDTVINENGQNLPQLSAQSGTITPTAATSTPWSAFMAQVQRQPQAAPAQPNQPVYQPTPAANTYVVRTGDSLSSIAARYGVSVGTLIKLNGMENNPNALYVGQVLRLPGNAPAATQAPQYSVPTVPQYSAPVAKPVPSAPSYITYTVAPGDTLSAIARRHSVTISDLLKINGITPDQANKLRVGQTLKLPHNR